MNLFLQVKQLISTFTGLFCKYLREQVHQKCPEKWQNTEQLIDHNNALAHTALSAAIFGS